MKVISTGSHFDIYPDDLKSFDELPADYYAVRFDPKTGFYLEKYSEFQMTETKIYGVHTEKVLKVIKAFENFNRNLGVILSGDKGIGKSLFARLLGREAVKRGIPVIIVDCYINGIGTYLDRIEQEVMVLFDEFDKTFSRNNHEDGDPQASMLSLFDGVAQGKKLFVVTCNELRGLNGFLVNRPGRFHYHFRFDYPGADAIREYLNDKLDDSAKGEIENVVRFSKRVALNFDCLRAIAYELNLGQTFAEAISDLNIINVNDEIYKVVARFEDGSILINKECALDLFNDDEKNVCLYDKQGRYSGEVAFSGDVIRFNAASGELFVDSEDASLDYETYEEDDEAARKELISKGLKIVTIQRVQSNNLHYAV